MSFSQVLHFHKKTAATLSFVLILLLLLVLWPFPASLKRQTEGVVLVECRNYYSIAVSPNDTLFFSPRLQGYAPSVVALHPDSVVGVRYGSGFFVSPRGHVLTSAHLLQETGSDFQGQDLHALLLREEKSIDSVRHNLKGQLSELDYYAHTHAPVDDGYQNVMDFRNETHDKLCALDTISHLIKKVLKQPTAKAVPHHLFTVRYNRAADSTGILSSTIEADLTACQDSTLALLCVRNERLPRHAYYFRTFWWSADHWPLMRAHRFVLGILHYILPEEELGRVLPDVLSAEQKQKLSYPLATGGPVTNSLGYLTGMQTPHGIIGAGRINTLLKRIHPFPLCFFKNLTARLASLKKAETEVFKTDTLRFSSPLPQNNIVGWFSTGKLYTEALGHIQYCGRMLHGKPDGAGTRRYPDGAAHSGEWKDGIRCGYGVYTDSLGNRYAGIWQADTLADGLFEDADGFYRGHFDKQLRRCGRGLLRTRSGGHYSGEWKDGKRDGFGFSVEPRRIVRCGVWHKDNFRGEQMIYTPRRVYGIDISRYQHEVGRKRYSIQWNKLRITHLGYTGRRVQGVIDYPVSFVYIKATQGTSIRSRYYAADAAAARRRGIPVGAYHFFSMKPGKQQALYFLRTVRPHRGDLPPMLDVELTDRQIAKMGGQHAMFVQMAQWLQTVERHCGTAPILYVSQRFVNKYMGQAPVGLKKYKVWIARYGEYKPYVHLQYWQLSPYGRVAGIHGQVDINVFNGTRETFEQMVRTCGVK